MEKSITIKSTSYNTAVASDIILRQKETTRLIFRPMIVNNFNNPGECVKGHFIYQRKSKNDQWEDTKNINLSNIKSGEGISLELKSKEMFQLIKNLAVLYKLYKAHGIVFGETEFILTNQNISGVLKQLMSESSNIEFLIKQYGDDLIQTNFNWLAKNSKRPEVIKKIMEIDVESINEVNRLIGHTRINKALNIWQKEFSNGDEEFWQTSFKNSPWILSQATSFPVIFLQGKAYVGGKTIDNKNGNILDFLYKNKLTENSVLIEIKTPTTLLLGKKYRNNSYSISDELSGGINQLLSYRDSLMRESTSLVSNSSDELKVYYPKCILIIGNLKSELKDDTQISSFERFRSEIKSVEIITYDELFERVSNIGKIINDFENA